MATLDEYPDHQVFRKVCEEGFGQIYHVVPLISDSGSNGYVGLNDNNLAKRFSTHLTPNSKCVGLRNAIRAHGRANFGVYVLQDNVPLHNLQAAEIHWIATKDTHKHGYNCTAGGESNPMDDPEVRKRHKKRMGDPVFIKRCLAKRLITFATPEFHARKVQAHKEAWARGGEELKQKHHSSMCAAYSSGKRSQEAQSTQMLEEWQKAGTRDDRIKRMKKSNQEPEKKEAKGKVSSERWTNTEYRDKIDAAWTAKREAKFASMPPKEAAKARRQWERATELRKRGRT